MLEVGGELRSSYAYLRYMGEGQEDIIVQVNCTFQLYDECYSRRHSFDGESLKSQR